MQLHSVKRPFFYKRIYAIVVFSVLFIIIFIGFNFYDTDNAVKVNDNNNIRGNLIIFHAGSLSVPVKNLCYVFKKKYPAVNIITEAAGSKVCAYKILELNRRCDVFLSSDIKIIENILMPHWADFALPFANNEMVIAYTNTAKYNDIINNKNWYNILLEDDVKTGRSDPASDPCGVRTIFLLKLAEKYYRVNFADILLNKNKKYLRPKETELLALLETKAIDYCFIYKSVAIQHNLKYIVLPDEINLSNKKYNAFYSTVYFETKDSKGKIIKEYGNAITYGLTIPKTCYNYSAAKAFVKFVLSEEGKEIIKENKQQI